MSNKSMTISQGAARYAAPSTLQHMVVFAVLFYALLGFQLMRFMMADAYSAPLSGLDSIGFLTIQLLAVMLGLRLFMLNKLQFVPVYLVIFFILYTALVITITAPDRSIIGFFIFRSGVMSWFVIGVGVAGILDVFQKARESQYAGLARWLVALASLAVSAMFVPFALRYLALPLPTIYYQSVASAVSIFMITVITCIEALWGRQKPLLVTASYLVLGSLLAAAVISMQSTSMAVIWVGLVGVFVWRQFWDSRLLFKLSLLFGLLVGIGYFTQTQIFQNIISNTRFSELASGGGVGNFSSLTSRLEILDSFGDQFAVSPFWGHFEAEVKSGAGVGYFIHSLPLSFLTHTGVVGFTLVMVILFYLLNRRVFSRRDNDTFELQLGRIMLLVLVLGTISTFMTWSVLWFMVGLLCLKSGTIYTGRRSGRVES